MRQNLYGFLQTKTYQYLNFWENILLIVWILEEGIIVVISSVYMYSIVLYVITLSLILSGIKMLYCLLYVHWINICFICNSLPLRGPLIGTIKIIIIIIQYINRKGLLPRRFCLHPSRNFDKETRYSISNTDRFFVSIVHTC